MFAGSDEYCASESFDASCGQNEAILMETANYGRMEGGRCIRWHIYFNVYSTIVFVWGVKSQSMHSYFHTSDTFQQIVHNVFTNVGGDPHRHVSVQKRLPHLNVGY